VAATAACVAWLGVRAALVATGGVTATLDAAKRKRSDYLQARMPATLAALPRQRAAANDAVAVALRRASAGAGDALTPGTRGVAAARGRPSVPAAAVTALPLPRLLPGAACPHCMTVDIFSRISGVFSFAAFMFSSCSSPLDADFRVCCSLLPCISIPSAYSLTGWFERSAA